MAPRTKFGTTWWGNQWLTALSNLDYANRLPRGRTYYNTGKIDSMSFNPETLKVEAVVSGSAYFPYEVTIQLKPLAKVAIDRLVDAIAERPTLVAKLLEGILDPEVGEIASSLGIQLFPQSWREFKMHCSCPDSAVPCKHLAAVYYGMVRTIDTDPMWVFYCRGVDLPALLRDRGIDLSEADTLEEPFPYDWLTWAEDANESLPSDEQILLNLKTESTTLFKRMTLLASEKGTTKVLNRGRFTRTLKGLQNAAKSLAKETKPYTDVWTKFESSFRGGEGVPVLTKHDVGLTLGITNSRGRAIGLSALDERRLYLSLFTTNPAGAETHSDALRYWSTLAQDALTLIENAAITPVLVRSTFDGTPHAHLVWMPTMQSAAVAAFVKRSAQRLADDPFDPFAKVDVSLEGATTLGKTVTLLMTLITGFVSFNDYTPASLRDQPLAQVLTTPTLTFAYGMDQTEIQALRQFFRPFMIGLMSLSWVPVLTVRTGKEGRVAMNLGVLPIDAIPTARPTLYRDILKEERFNTDRFALIRLFEHLCDYCTPLHDILESHGKPVSLEKDRLKDFLFEAVPMLDLLGVRVMLPKRLQNLLKPTLNISITGASGSGMLTAESMGQFNWKVAIGDRELTEEEFNDLLAHAGEVIQYEDDFIYLDPERLQALKTQMEALEGAGYLEMMKAVMTGELGDTPVAVPADLLARVDELMNVTDVEMPAGLHASLRPYQARGYAWLMKNLRLGLGSLIADDMGLGKTLQVITALLALKNAGELKNEKVLALVPATLLTNWVREIARFAPALSVEIYHGVNRRLKPITDRADVILTTYGTYRQDQEILKKEPWRLLVLDEAQAVKNITTGVTKAVRDLHARQVIAMSGTPVENRLSEYWSILSIVQPGLLGTPDEFKEVYAQPIESNRDQKALEAFRRVTAPFMLRRLKTDKSIISDLPDKIVCNRYVDLTPEQAALYGKTLQSIMDKIKALTNEEGRQKKTALVLRLITALKQICNSPSLYVKSQASLPDSGKGNALLELIDECREAGRKALIFTQYAEMGEKLQAWLAKATGRRPDFLHGGVTVKARAKMVDDFQANPDNDILIISLKAGGTGLNLTAASVVIHYDLWWNPAVENQATDRAFRIGQRRDVLVYRFLCAGTFEERINDMLDAKRELADLTVTTGEHWIGELSTDELQNLFGLETPEK